MKKLSYNLPVERRVIDGKEVMVIPVLELQSLETKLKGRMRRCLARIQKLLRP